LTPQLQAIIALSIYFAGFLMSVVAHEYSHAWMAEKFGDPTARLLGRLTWNPLKHIDPMWTVVIPIFAFVSGIPLIGGAKPVPVNPLNFAEPRRADRFVSVAGVAANLIIALALALVLKTNLLARDSILFVVFGMVMRINVILLIFNLLPLPPLDGSHIVATFLPEPAATKYRSMGMLGFFVILALMWSGMFWSWFSRVEAFVLLRVLRLDGDMLFDIIQGYLAICDSVGR